MTDVLKRIHVGSGTDVDHLLDEAAVGPVLLQRDGELFRLSREIGVSDLWADYDPDKVREALRRTTGPWADLDTDSLIADLLRAREEGSRPASRP